MKIWTAEITLRVPIGAYSYEGAVNHAEEVKKSVLRLLEPLAPGTNSQAEIAFPHEPLDFEEYVQQRIQDAEERDKAWQGLTNDQT